MKNLINTREAFPLSWPEGTKRTPQSSRKRAQFKGTLHSAVKMVNEELRRLGAKDVIISTDVPIRKDGLPYSEYKRNIDVGVAVYFTYEGEPTVFCCDKWQHIEDNMKAIALTIEATRGLDRWGVSDMLKRLFLGFAALPEYSGGLTRPWYEVLEVNENADQEEIRKAYLKLSMKLHPDNQETGDQDKFTELAAAYEKGKKQ